MVHGPSFPLLYISAKLRSSENWIASFQKGVGKLLFQCFVFVLVFFDSEKWCQSAGCPLVGRSLDLPTRCPPHAECPPSHIQQYKFRMTCITFYENVAVILQLSLDPQLFDGGFITLKKERSTPWVSEKANNVHCRLSHPSRAHQRIWYGSPGIQWLCLKFGAILSTLELTEISQSFLALVH